MKKTKSRILASFVAVMLCFTAFSTVAFANGNDPEAKPETTASTEQAEETEAPKRDVANMLNEEVIVRPIRERLHQKQKHQTQQRQNGKKNRDSWER